MVSCGDDGTLRAWRPSATLSDSTSQDTMSKRKLVQFTVPLDAANTPSAQNSTWSRRTVQDNLPSSESNNETSHDPVSVMITKFSDIDTRHESDSSKNEPGSGVGPSGSGSRDIEALRRQQTPPRRAVRTGEISMSNGKRKLDETSPQKRSPAKRLILSPSKTNGEYRSPTFNLPNYVAEGSGPSHSCPRARCKENLDWLTKMRRHSTSKKAASAEKAGKRQRFQSSKRSSRKTLLEYYKKSSKGTDDLAQKTWVFWKSRWTVLSDLNFL